jgi:hypothetical protein
MTEEQYISILVALIGANYNPNESLALADFFRDSVEERFAEQIVEYDRDDPEPAPDADLDYPVMRMG